MTVQLTPLSPRALSVGRAEDPYKKYWIMILAGCVLLALWLSLPMMDTPIGSAHVDPSKSGSNLAADEQSLNAVKSAQGVEASGSPIDLSMGASKAKTTSQADDPTSMLYQAPSDGAAAAGTPVAASASASLAQQLKNVGQSNAGGWGEKAQRGFEAPHLAGGGLGGIGAVSGGSSASMGVNSAFGARVAQVTFGAAQGLQDASVGGPGKGGGGGGMQALRNAANMANSAAAQRSGDAAVGNLTQAFDGADKNKAIGAGVAGAGGATYSRLDEAPVNLKVNNPNLNKRELKAPPGHPGEDGGSGMPSLAQQLMQVAIPIIIGGMIPGIGGQLTTAMTMVMMQRQQMQAAEQRAMEHQHHVGA